MSQLDRLTASFISWLEGILRPLAVKHLQHLARKYPSKEDWRYKNAANFISLGRAIASPLVAWLVYLTPNAWVRIPTLLVLVTALIISDKYDGMLARLGELITKLGKLLDPAGDKILVGCLGFALCFKLGFVPLWWVFSVLMLIELGNVGIGIVNGWYGERIGNLDEVGASSAGQRKMYVESVTIFTCWMLASFVQFDELLATSLFGVSAVFAAISFKCYVDRVVVARRRYRAMAHA